MKHEDAYKIIQELGTKENLQKHILKGQVCGSYRRGLPNVNDIDWVIIPFGESVYQFGDESLNDTIKRLHQGTSEQLKLGDKIKTFFYKGISIELYIATEDTFETLILIRTGSKEHNIKLTTLAKQKGMKLFASGTGLCSMNGDEVISVVENTEDGILKNLLGRIPSPEERN